MPGTEADGLPATPQFVAVRAIFQNANSSDRTAETVGHGDEATLNLAAAHLCRRAADDLVSRQT
ncbi:hypothetical protein ES703_80571 [subsurface metagenome]